ncbi:glycosyl hydrolase family 28-related protein [Enterobacter roggenkampii]|uniref:tail fiber/spike domain-containing protein n=1 Tax=Enterobacter roggenkampii TaxID=1812935 RepID=UPI0024492761|nr:glycosyl hydrolase family 28-related protein [Enterobacter roggenkampii]MDH0516549.1 hypothetical protein [Enterobacter roggenkampii]
MATQPTNLPVPSESPRDLKFNAGKIDEFVTSMGSVYTDRFGVQHYTIEGMRWLAQQAIAEFGYITMDSFEDGNTLTLPNQVLRLEATGEYYRWDGALPKNVPSASTPDSTGGIGPGAWLNVGYAALKQQLSNTSDPSFGDALVGVKQSFASAIGRTQHDKNAETVSITDWGTPSGLNSTKIQAALNELASKSPGATMHFPSGTYTFSGITLPSSISIKGDGVYESSTIFVNDSATQPFFSGDGVSNISISNVKMKAGPTRSANPFIDLKNATRIKFSDMFIQNYFTGIEIDGGSEISLNGIRCFTNLSGSGVGCIRIGKTTYTGTVNFNDVFIKQHPDNITAQPEYGVRLGYVDVVSFDGSFLCILHGKCLLVDPGNGQIASLIHGNGAYFDTADYGIFLVPSGTGKVQAFDFEGVYSGAHRIAALAIDGTSGTVDGASFNGGDYINSSIGIDVTGAKAKNIIINGVKVAGSSTQGIHITNNANVVVKDNFIGNFGFGANNYGIVADVTTSGQVFNNKFQNNTVNIDNQSVNLSVFDNIGIDNWNAFTPTITSQSGTITTASGVLRYRKSFNTVTVNAEITITNNGTGANSVLVTLPFTVRTHAVGVGRAQLISGKELQAFASAGGINVAIRNYDGTYPGTTGEVLIFSITYETQN